MWAFPTDPGKISRLRRLLAAGDDPELLQPVPERVAGEAEEAGRAGLVAVGVLERLPEELRLHLSPVGLTPAELVRTETLRREKYATDAWTRRV